MNNQSKQKSSFRKLIERLFDKETIAFILFLGVAFFLVNYFFDKKDREIIANREYTIAHVIKKYDYGEKAKGGQYGAGASFESVDFSYTYKGKTYKANCPIGRNKGFDETIYDYLLIIDKDNPERFILRFDYPILNKNNLYDVIVMFEKENIKNAP